MAETQDVDALRRRGRRRLVGAIALALLAVIVLPMVFDRQPERNPAVSVRIPNENEVEARLRPQTNLASTAPAPTGAQTAAPASVVKPEPTVKAESSAKPEATAKSEPAKAEPAPQAPPAPQAAAKGEKHASASAADTARAKAALAGKEFIVPVAALAEQERVKALTARLRSAKLPYYTEAIHTKSGKITRVRVGPFVSREEAEQAHAKLVKLGLKPGRVMTKS